MTRDNKTGEYRPMKLNLGTNYNTYPFRDMTIQDQALYLFRVDASKKGFTVEIVDHSSYIFFRLKDKKTGIRSRIRDIPLKAFLDLEFMNASYESIYNLFRGVNQ